MPTSGWLSRSNARCANPNSNIIGITDGLREKTRPTRPSIDWESAEGQEDRRQTVRSEDSLSSGRGFLNFLVKNCAWAGRPVRRYQCRQPGF